MKTNIQKGVNLFIGFFFALLFSLTIRCVFYIYSYNNWGGSGIYDLFALISFILLIAVWFKTKKTYFKIAVTFILLGSYVLGRNYAVREYETFKVAHNLFIEANSEQGLAWKKESDTEKYIQGERLHINTLKKISEMPNLSLRWGRDYFQQHYEYQKEFLDYDESILNGSLKTTEEETKELAQKVNEKITALNQYGYILPFWMDFFLVRR